MEACRAARLAVALWLTLALVVWNVVFDRLIVLAGRRYVYAADMSARTAGAYLHIDNWMRPAIAHGVWIASVASVCLLAAGLVAIRIAARRDRARA